MDLGCLLEILSGMIKMIINLLLLLLSVIVKLSCIFTQKCVQTFFITPWGGICAYKSNILFTYVCSVFLYLWKVSNRLENALKT